MPHSSVSAISGDCRVRNLRALLIPGADSGRPAAEPLRGPRGYHGCARVGAGARYRVLLPFWALPAPRGPLPHPRHTIPPPLKQMRTQAPTKESKRLHPRFPELELAPELSGLREGRRLYGVS